MLCQFLLYNKMNQLYIYVYLLIFRFCSHIGHYRVLSRVQSRFLLVIYFIYSRVYMLISVSQFILSPLLSPLQKEFVEMGKYETSFLRTWYISFISFFISKKLSSFFYVLQYSYHFFVKNCMLKILFLYIFFCCYCEWIFLTFFLLKLLM